MALGVALAADIAGPRQVCQHLRKAHRQLPFQPARLLRPRLSLAWPPPLAPLRLRRRLLPRLDRRRIPRDVLDKMAIYRPRNQRLMQTAGQTALGKLGKGPRKRRLARKPAGTAPAAQPAKPALQEIWMAETRNGADSAFDAFIETYAVKYDKAAACLVKDRATMLAFYDFPAEHWKHLRTTNPIESTFATVRHRTVRSKGCLSNKTALAMVFKLAQAAQDSWRRLDGHNQLPKLIVGVKFIDGIEAVRQQPQAAA